MGAETPVHTTLASCRDDNEIGVDELPPAGKVTGRQGFVHHFIRNFVTLRHLFDVAALSVISRPLSVFVLGPFRSQRPSSDGVTVIFAATMRRWGLHAP
jgi:hypothetical protein